VPTVLGLIPDVPFSNIGCYILTEVPRGLTQYQSLGKLQDINLNYAKTTSFQTFTFSPLPNIYLLILHDHLSASFDAR